MKFHVFVAVISVIIVASYCLDCKKNTLERKLSKKEISAIVDTHNKARSLLEKGKIKNQPRASKLYRLKWDSTLAEQAQKIADTCKFKHVPVKDKRWSVGQNLFKQSSTALSKRLNVTDAVYAWINEHKYYKYPKYTKKTGHYTQVIAARSKSIGCGFIHYKTKGKFKYHKILVCNYGPAGNVQGQAPYKLHSTAKKKFS